MWQKLLAHASEPNAIEMADDLVLLGDIGATNARLALYRNGALGPVEWMAAAQFAHFAEAVEAFLIKRGRPAVSSAMIAVAGPVERNRAEMTNRGWIIDGAELCAQFRMKRARLLNDFEATGWSLPHLDPAKAVNADKAHTPKASDSTWRPHPQAADEIPASPETQLFLLWAYY